jgi:hypothetical protein
MKHFEKVWEEAELIDPSNSEEAISSLLLKINLYRALLDKDKESKEQLFGEILFDLAKLSKSENINVYKCLNKINNQKIQHLVKIA